MGSKDSDRKLLLDAQKFRSFPIRVEFIIQNVVEERTRALYQQYLVLVNGFVFATFVDQLSFEAYMKYFKEHGLTHILPHTPKQIMDIIEAESKNLTLNELKQEKGERKV